MPPLLRQQLCTFWAASLARATVREEPELNCRVKLGWLLPCVYTIYLLLLQTSDTDGDSFESGTPTLDTAAFIFLMFWLHSQRF